MLRMRSWRIFQAQKNRSFVCHKWKKFGTFKKLKIRDLMKREGQGMKERAEAVRRDQILKDLEGQTLYYLSKKYGFF